MDTHLLSHSINSFEVPEGYNVFFVSPLVNKINDAQIICLPEIHQSLFRTSQKQNAKLIDTFIENNPDKKILVLVEGVKSLEIVNQKGHEQVHFCKKKFVVKGWDIEDSEIYNYSDELAILAEKVDRANEECLILKYPLDNDLLTSLEEEKDVRASILKSYRAFESLAKEYAIACNSEGITDEYVMERAVMTFPSRNNKMMETLIKVTDLYDIIFVIAGASHFIHYSEYPPLMNVKPLRDFLETQRAIILESTEKHKVGGF